jgi:biopolymer transport protein ExbD
MTLTPHAWRRRDARAVYEQHTGPNMTPMVDVVMVILIFFMASTVILGPELLLQAGLDRTRETRAGGGGDARFAIEPPSFTVRLHAEGGTVVVSGLGLRAGPLSALSPAARALAAEVERSVPIVLVPEDSVPYEAVILAQETLMEAGFRSIRLR